MNKRELKDIYCGSNLLEEEIDLMESYIEEDNDGCFIETRAFEKLFNYFCESGEMPYGVAKARTGDPDDWILNRLRGTNQERSNFLDKLKHII